VLYNHGQLGYRYDTDNFDELRPGQQIWSANAQYYLTYESGGHLVLYSESPNAKCWESGTDRQTPGFCRMEGYGTLVIYGQGGRQVWASNSGGSEGSRLLVRNDGRVAIYQPDGRQLWIVPPPPMGNP
jgi:hypothetical protein